MLELTRNRLGITTVGVFPIFLARRFAVGTVIIMGKAAAVILIPDCNVAGNTAASSFTESPNHNPVGHRY